jgi:hypothetical protein
LLEPLFAGGNNTTILSSSPFSESLMSFSRADESCFILSLYDALDAFWFSKNIFGSAWLKHDGGDGRIEIGLTCIFEICRTIVAPLPHLDCRIPSRRSDKA